MCLRFSSQSFSPDLPNFRPLPRDPATSTCLLHQAPIAAVVRVAHFSQSLARTQSLLAAATVLIPVLSIAVEMPLPVTFSLQGIIPRSRTKPHTSPKLIAQSARAPFTSSCHPFPQQTKGAKVPYFGLTLSCCFYSSTPPLNFPHYATWFARQLPS